MPDLANGKIDWSLDYKYYKYIILWYIDAMVVKDFVRQPNLHLAGAMAEHRPALSR